MTGIKHSLEHGANPMSTDDLGYLCQWNGHGQPLMMWEELPFDGTASDIQACVADHVEYWIDIQTEHIRINSVRGKKGLPPISSEREIYLLHKYVCEKRWRRRTDRAARVTLFERCL